MPLTGRDPGRLDGPRRLSGPALVGVLVAAALLIGVIALSSRPAVIPSGAEPPHASSIAVVLQVVLYMAILVSLGVLALLVQTFWPERRRKRKPGPDEFEMVYEPPEVPWIVKFVMLLAPFALTAALIVVLLRTHFGQEVLGGATGKVPALTPSPTSGVGSAPAQASSVPAPTVLMALGIVSVLVVLLLAIVLWSRWRYRRLDFGLGTDRRTEASEAVDVSLEALLQEPDPRRAVIAAYVAMERSLSRAGLGRRPFEAPIEYLRRVLAASTSASEEVRTITHLFQLAKFSRHAVDETMRHKTLTALERVRAGTR